MKNEIIESYDGIEFALPYMKVDNFKQKTFDTIVALIGGTRLLEYMSYDGGAIMTFKDDDIQERHPVISIYNSFNRLKTNCIAYTLTKNPKNYGYYDKLFIYHHGNDRNGFYGFLAYNTKTGNHVDHFCIDHTYDALTHHLHMFFNALGEKEIKQYYSDKYDCLKGRNGKTHLDCPTYVDYLNIRKNMQQRYIDYYHNR